MSDCDCLVFLGFTVVIIIAFVFAFPIVFSEDPIDIDIDEDDIFAGETANIDILVNGDFESCNLAVNFSKHFQVIDYVIYKGHLGNQTELTDFSIKNLNIKSINGLSEKFVLLRMVVKPYHIGKGYINLDMKYGSSDKFSDNVTINIERRSDEIPKINISNRNESNECNLSDFNINTPENLTSYWVITKDEHVFLNDTNYTFTDGNYLVSLVVNRIQNYSDVYTFHVNMTDGDESLEPILWAEKFDSVDDDEGINFLLVIFVSLSIVGTAVGYLFFEYIM